LWKRLTEDQRTYILERAKPGTFFHRYLPGVASESNP
jgi:hypothetical protein